MSAAGRPSDPGRPNPAQLGDHPLEVRSLLLAIDDPEVRDKVLRVYNANLEGATGSVALYHSIMLSAVYNAICKQVAAGVEAMPSIAQKAAEQQSAVISKDVRAQIDQLRALEQAAREKHQAELNDKIEEARWRECKLAAEKAKGRDRAIVHHGVTAAATAVVILALANWLSGKRADEAEARAAVRYSEELKALNAQYARDIKGLAGAANFVAQVDGVGGSVTYQRTDAGVLRVTIDFGDLPIANVAKTSPRQAIIDLAPNPEPTPAPHARQTSAPSRH